MLPGTEFPELIVPLVPGVPGCAVLPGIVVPGLVTLLLSGTIVPGVVLPGMFDGCVVLPDDG